MQIVLMIVVVIVTVQVVVEVEVVVKGEIKVKVETGVEVMVPRVLVVVVMVKAVVEGENGAARTFVYKSGVVGIDRCAGLFITHYSHLNSLFHFQGQVTTSSLRVLGGF